MRLFHYTCEHARAGIIETGVLRPNARSYRGLLWLTDLDQPDVPGLGLTSFMLNCDRTAYKITVETDCAEPWATWAHSHHVPTLVRLALDGNPGTKPRNWYVATEEIPFLAIEPTFSKAKNF